MSIRRKILLGLSVAAVGLLAQTANASAAVRPMTFDECGTNGDGAYNCMYIEGGGDSAIEVRGWSDPGSKFIGWDAHEQVVMPNGGTYCNSATIDITNSSDVVGCQGGPGNIETGQWCAILWVYVDGGNYENAAENCGTVSA
ncbi:MAG: hypothetical protein ABSA93_36660 [Streptosporangiaceae bacterium]|jgi:hypothetical protein